MKAKVIETSEIINVHCFYPVTYSRLDCNGKIIEEYDEDELEFIYNKPKKTLIDLDEVCEFLRNTNKGTFPYSVIEELRKKFKD